MPIEKLENGGAGGAKQASSDHMLVTVVLGD